MRRRLNEVLALIDRFSAFTSKIQYKRALLTFQKTLDARPSPKVLIALEDSGIGNTIHATPMIQAIRMLWNKAHITLLLQQEGLLDEWCVPDRVVHDPENVQNESFEHTFFAYWCIRRAPLWAREMRLGKTYCAKLLYPNFFVKSEREIYMDMAKRAGYCGPTPPPYVPVRRPQEAVLSNSYICIVPGGKPAFRWRHKRWPYYAPLIRSLADAYPDHKICIIGTKEDQIEPSGVDGILDLRGQLRLSETAYVLKNASLVIGNDCGPMHLSSAVNAPSIAIMGPVCIIKNTYYGKTKMICPEEIHCWPCQYDTDKSWTCMAGDCIKSISVRDVLRVVENLFKR